MWNYKLTLKFRAKIKEQFVVAYDIKSLIHRVSILRILEKPLSQISYS